MTTPPEGGIQPPQTRAQARAVQRQAATRRFSSGFSTVRDVLSFGCGMAVILHEVFLGAEVRAAVIGVGVTLTGLPIMLGADERRGRG